MSETPSISYLPDIHRLLPQSPDAEQGVLSSLLLAPNDVAVMCHSRGVTAKDFHIPAHAEVFESAMDLHHGGKPLDFITLSQVLRDRDKLGAVGGAPFISSLFTFLPTAANAEHYLDLVREKSRLRSVIDIGTRWAAMAYEARQDPAEVINGFYADVSALIGQREARMTVAKALEDIKFEVINGKPDSSLFLTGWPVLDKRLALYLGDFMVISAPTSCGKSALALQIAVSCAQNGKHSAFYPLEMSTKATMKRGLAILSGDRPDFIRGVVQGASVPPSSFATRKVREFCDAYAVMKQLPLYVRDDLHDFDAIVADIRAQNTKKRLSFVCVDYLQLIQLSGRWERKQLAIAHMTQRFKVLAKELELVICVPSQVNKDGGTREAQDAENDASALLKIIAKEAKNGDPEFERLQVWKQREGQRFVDIPVTFNGALTRFEESKI